MAEDDFVTIRHVPDFVEAEMLLDLLKQDEDVSRALSENDLTALFDLDYHLKHVETIFARVFGA